MTLRHVIGQCIPRGLRALLNDLGPHGYKGHYPTWEAVQAHAAGDEPDAMIERTAAATAAVCDGLAEYEQDTVLMPPPAEAAHLLDAIRGVAGQTGGSVHVVELGGALGSKFFWARRALEPSIDLRWTVVELERHVERGRQQFASEALCFERTIEAAARPVDIVACYSALQYLPQPVSEVRAFVRTGARAILLDRIPYATSGRAELTLQRVDAGIYLAALPSWLLEEPAIVAAVGGEYRLAARWEYPRVYTRRAVFTSHLFVRSSSQA